MLGKYRRKILLFCTSVTLLTIIWAGCNPDTPSTRQADTRLTDTKNTNRTPRTSQALKPDSNTTPLSTGTRSVSCDVHSVNPPTKADLQ